MLYVLLKNNFELIEMLHLKTSLYKQDTIVQIWAIYHYTKALWRNVSFHCRRQFLGTREPGNGAESWCFQGHSEEEKARLRDLRYCKVLVGGTHQVRCIMRRSEETGMANTFTPGWLVWTSLRLPARSRSRCQLGPHYYSSNRKERDYIF